MNDKKTWFRLFHGRNEDNPILEGIWGKDGPVFGPVAYVHTVYGDYVNFAFEAARDDDHHMVVDDGCIQYQGMGYGDWSVFSATEDEAAKEGTITGPESYKPAADA